MAKYFSFMCPLCFEGQRFLRREQVCPDQFTSWAV